jgi:hypothetical protein
MATQKILLPYNFTSYDQKALDFVIRTFANRKDVEVTLFNAYVPLPEIDMRASPIMEKVTSNLHYISQRINEQETELKAVVKTLLGRGFSETQIKTIFAPQQKDVADDIIKHVVNGQFDVVVLNRNPSKIISFFTGSAFNKIVKALKDITVCIVS